MIRSSELLEAPKDIPPSLNEWIAMVKDRNRIQIDVGFGSNLPNFISGQSIKPISFQELHPCFSFEDKPALLFVVGAGSYSSDPKKPWFDITALRWEGELRFELQGSQGIKNGSRVPLNQAVDQPNDIHFYPIAQLLYFTQKTKLDSEDTLFIAQTNRTVHFREALQIAQPKISAKKIFALILGNFTQVELRPLKERGPIPGRPFDSTRHSDSDVEWVTTSDFQGTIVASLDQSSYTSIHAHTISLTNIKPPVGGHLENAILQQGSYLILIAAHQYITL